MLLVGQTVTHFDLSTSKYSCKLSVSQQSATHFFPSEDNRLGLSLLQEETQVNLLPDKITFNYFKHN